MTNETPIGQTYMTIKALLSLNTNTISDDIDVVNLTTDRVSSKVYGD